MSVSYRETAIHAARVAERRPMIVGLGAIGSWVARWLEANGISFTAYDDDVVSLKNVGAGAFALSDVGTLKASAIGSGCYSFRWDETRANSRSSVWFACADHGATRRQMAEYARLYDTPMYCAKANGADFQIWPVRDADERADFIAFDEAAEANPVRVPCGHSSVGRVASIGAAAALLSAWLKIDVTPDEVEKSYGVAFDPAIGHILPKRWEANREKAELDAHEAARQAFDKSIDALRAASDEMATQDLQQMRRERRERRRRLRTSIHARAIVILDEGGAMETAARVAVLDQTPQRPLERIAQAEANIAAREIEAALSVPETIRIEQVSA